MTTLRIITSRITISILAIRATYFFNGYEKHEHSAVEIFQLQPREHHQHLRVSYFARLLSSQVFRKRFVLLCLMSPV